MSVWARLGRIAYWGVWPGSWLYLRGSHRTRLLLENDDSFLVVNNWLGTGKWNLPGGGLHKGEDPGLGLLRELYEETGVSLDAGDLRVLAEEPYRIHGFSYRCTYFYARVAHRPMTRRRKPEITAIDWAPRQQITSKAYGPDVLRALQLLDSA